jgi:hypothetical protein
MVLLFRGMELAHLYLPIHNAGMVHGLLGARLALNNRHLLSAGTELQLVGMLNVPLRPQILLAGMDL